jgi:hypothetical protein
VLLRNPPPRFFHRCCPPLPNTQTRGTYRHLLSRARPCCAWLKFSSLLASHRNRFGGICRNGPPAGRQRGLQRHGRRSRRAR